MGRVVGRVEPSGNGCRVAAIVWSTVLGMRETSLLYTITMLSYLVPDLKIRSVTAAVSAKVGISRPVWLNVIARFLGRAQESWALDLSPSRRLGVGLLDSSTGCLADG